MRPFEKSAEETARRRRTERRLQRFGERLGEARARVRRTTFEMQAAARSSAAIAGAENDAGRIARWFRERIFHAKALARLGDDSRRATRYLDAEASVVAGELQGAAAKVVASARRAKRRALERSRMAAGLAIDSHRIARRLRGMRRTRRGRATS